MNDEESGKMACLSLHILLEGAVSWLENHPRKLLAGANQTLNPIVREEYNSECIALCSEIFQQAYWISPFRDVTNLRSGVLKRVHSCNSNEEIPEGISKLIEFIQELLITTNAPDSASCLTWVNEICKPAILECESLIIGNIPAKANSEDSQST